MRALPRASCVHTCNLLARTVTWLLCLPGATGQPAHPSASQWGTLWKSSRFVSSFFFSSSFLLRLLFNSAKESILFAFFLNLNFFKFSLFSLNSLVVYFASYELLSKIQRSGKVEIKMKRRRPFLSGILSDKWLLCELLVTNSGLSVFVRCLIELNKWNSQTHPVGSSWQSYFILFYFF